MDKETLSNYGLIVICVLVIAVMVALATPFGQYVKTGVENTAEGLFQTEKGALSVVGVSIDDQSFSNKYVHISLDDAYFWTDLIDNENNYNSCFENTCLGSLKDLHDEYGCKFTLNCLVIKDDYDFEDVPSKWASEFRANKSWLRFSFHGTTPSETFGTDMTDELTNSYNSFISGIYNMTSDYDCIDNIVRLSSFVGTLNNVKALHDANHGITGLLTTDRKLSQTARNSYYQSNDIGEYMHTHSTYYDETNGIWFVRSLPRLEDNAITSNPPTLLETDEYANINQHVEVFWHDTFAWHNNSVFNNYIKPWLDYFKDNGYVYIFSEDVL